MNQNKKKNKIKIRHIVHVKDFIILLSIICLTVLISCARKENSSKSVENQTEAGNLSDIIKGKWQHVDDNAISLFFLTVTDRSKVATFLMNLLLTHFQQTVFCLLMASNGKLLMQTKNLFSLNTWQGAILLHTGVSNRRLN